MTNTDLSLRHGWHPVARSSDIGDEPVSVRLLGEPWVIARLDNRVMALADHCPYLLTPSAAGRVDGPRRACAYHGWRFVASGACTAMPGPEPASGPTPGSPGPPGSRPGRTRAASAWGATERHGLVWIAPEEPFADIIDLPEADDSVFASRWLDVNRSRACAGVLADDLLEAASLPFVHPSVVCADPVRGGPIRAGAGGTGEQTITFRRDITTDGNGFRLRMEQTVTSPANSVTTEGGSRPWSGRRQLSTCLYRPPFQLRLVLRCPDTGTTSTIFFCLQPEDATSTRVYARLFRNDCAGSPDRLAEAARVEQMIIDLHLTARERHPLDGLPLPATSHDITGSTGSTHTDADALTNGAPGSAQANADTVGAALRRALSALAEQARGIPARDRPAGIRYARRVKAGSRP
ncbi:MULTISPECIES: Rieske 2Fe-2S domain-containing protein [unclassified Frankia]|uniref:Rieske 2Fe-2S domain-containing protein n=1 Tax=unclassified Frankia TaxID=2632575 RepID=UPI0020240183